MEEAQGEVSGVHALPCTSHGVKGMKETKSSRGERAIVVDQSVARADGAPNSRMLLTPRTAHRTNSVPGMATTKAFLGSLPGWWERG